jgi:hypothetical protein
VENWKNGVNPSVKARQRLALVFGIPMADWRPSLGPAEARLLAQITAAVAAYASTLLEARGACHHRSGWAPDPT